MTSQLSLSGLAIGMGTFILSRRPSTNQVLAWLNCNLSGSPGKSMATQEHTKKRKKEKHARKEINPQEGLALLHNRDMFPINASALFVTE